MKTLRREIHPQVKVIDSTKGLVEYVASNETLDSHNEIVRADGWRFNRFQKNAPFVDSHNYESIECLLGKVVDFRVIGRKVIETVQWAIDVPSNLLAKRGFEMTAAGYLKAVSVGFIPIKAATRWDSDKSDYNAQCSELNLSRDVMPDVIYIEQEQLELSACVIGSNPDAVAQIEKAYRDGILSDSDISHFSKISRAFARAFEQQNRRSTTFNLPATQPGTVAKMLAVLGHHQPSTQTPTDPMKKTFLENFKQLTRGSKSAIEDIETTRRDGNYSELERAVRRAFASVALENQSNYGNPIARYLEENPERRFFWNGIARKIAGKLRIGSPEYRAVEAAYGGTTDFEEIKARSIEMRAASGINLQDQFGFGLLLSVPVADEIYDLLLHYGAYKYLGLRRMIGAYTQYVKATGFPTAVFITPTQQGQVTIPADTTLTGDAVTPQANTIAALISASREWLADEKVDLSEAIFSKFVQGLAARIDWGAYQGNGADDENNGMTTGIFIDPAIASAAAITGAQAIENLTRPDFINVIGQVNAAALQRMDTLPPRWYINPAFIPKLLLLRDGDGPQYLLKTPAETGGEWLLVGFPVTWVAAAPSANVRGAKVLAFGNPDAYLVALHEGFEITNSEGGAAFAANNSYFRAIGRGRSVLREATGFATLKLA